MIEQSIDLTTLADKLPPIISRNKIDKYLGGIITAKTLANLDSLGEGPPRIKIGRNVGYPTLTFLSWLQGRSEAPQQGT